MESGRNLNSSKLSCMSSLPARMRMIESKMKELECVICLCVSEKLMYTVVNTLAPTFLIESSSFFQLTLNLKPGQP